MNIIVSDEKRNVPVTVIRLEGRLDGQTFEMLIAKARELYEGGARDLLLDLAELTYMSSAGIVALNTVALMLRGEALPDPEHGWAGVRSAERTRELGVQKHLKLLNLRPEVYSVLDMVGLIDFFESFTDLETALKSF